MESMNELQKKQYELEVSNNIMKELFNSNPSHVQFAALRDHVMNMQGSHTGEEPTHLFCNGMYTRVLPIPAGDLIFGKKHKLGHFTMLMHGHVSINDEKGNYEMTGPMIWVSEPGVQRTIYAYTDCVLLTVHRTDSTDLETIEDELIIKE